jgi:hypothetical protein
MLKEHEPPKERARYRAERKWKNAEAIKRIKEARQKPKLVDPNAKPEIAETITNEGRVDGPVKRFESKLKRDIRTMMEGYSRNNLEQHAAFLEGRRYKLLKEKLRRLKLQQSEEAGNGKFV